MTMVSKGAKLLLKNTIQSLEYQNRIKEEKEMWNKLQNDRRVDDMRPTHSSSDRLVNRSTKRRYEEVEDTNGKHNKTDDTKRGNYWLKKLMAEEEKNSSERWTHNGFKELYSEELASDKSGSDSDKDTKKRNKKKSKKHKKHKKHKKNKK